MSDFATLSSRAAPVYATAPIDNVPQPTQLALEAAYAEKEINIFRLLRELNTFLKKLYGDSYALKAEQSFNHLQLQLQNAVMHREIGDEKWWINLGKTAGALVVGVIALKVKNAHLFGSLNHTVESIVSMIFQGNITDKEVASKKNEAYMQSIHSVQDGVTKQIEQLSQMIRELLHAVKDIKDSRHQALASLARN